MLSPGLLNNLGRLLRNIKDPKWLAAQAGEMLTQIYVIGPVGDQIKAYFRVHLFDGDKKIGEVYHCKDGHEYLLIDGKKIRFDKDSEDFHHA
jgi:hypothetical protein